MKNRVINSILSQEDDRLDQIFLVNHDELVEDLEKLLREGIVQFSYKTSKGEIRNAYGTLKADLIPDKNANDYKRIFDELADLGLRASNGIDGEHDEHTLRALCKSASEIRDKNVEARMARKAKPKSTDNVVYYDLGSVGFRSFKKEKLVTVIR